MILIFRLDKLIVNLIQIDRPNKCTSELTMRTSYKSISESKEILRSYRFVKGKWTALRA